MNEQVFNTATLRADRSMLRLTRGFTNRRLTLTPGLTSRAF